MLSNNILNAYKKRGELSPNKSDVNSNSIIDKPISSNITSLSKTDSFDLNNSINKNNFGFLGFFDKSHLANDKNQIKSYKIDDQGDTNSCGTTSLHSVLKYYGDDVKDHWEIDKEIRSVRFDFFTSPGHIVDYAKDKGYKAGLKNESNLEDIAKYIDQGVPIMTLIDPGSEYNLNLHWVVVTGYERDDKGNIKDLKVSDPGTGSTYKQSAKSFREEWTNLKLGKRDVPLFGDQTVETGYDRLIVVITPKNKTLLSPEGNKINSNSIDVPKSSNTIKGILFADPIAGGGLIVDRTITYAEKAKNYISGGVTKIAKSLGF